MISTNTHSICYETIIPFIEWRRKWIKISSPSYLPMQSNLNDSYLFTIEYINIWWYINIELYPKYKLEYIDEKKEKVSIVTTYKNIIILMKEIIEVENYKLECSKDY